MRRFVPLAAITLVLAVAACGKGPAPEDRDARPPLEAPVSAPSAYAVFTAADMDGGWDVLDAMDTELPALQRDRIQARGAVSGGSRSMMIRFAGECSKDGGFVAAVRAVARRHDVQQVRCASTLPEH